MRRDPLEAPENEGQDYRGVIEVLHPAYSERVILFQQVGRDSPSGAIHLPLVLTACAIVACNRFDGYFSDSREADTITPDDMDEFLEPGVYFFHVPKDFAATKEKIPPNWAHVYPIVATFSNWSFPNEAAQKDVLGQWLEATSERSVDTSCPRCVVSNATHAVDKVRVIPTTQERWAWLNELDRLLLPGKASGTLADKMDLVENFVNLRSDIHDMLNKKHIVFYPKPDKNGRLDLAVHYGFDDDKIAATFHNRTLHPMAEVPWEYLLVRFAWSLFPLRSLLSVDQAVLLRLYDKSTSSWIVTSWHPRAQTPLAESPRPPSSATDLDWHPKSRQQIMDMLGPEMILDHDKESRKRKRGSSECSSRSAKVGE